MGESWPGHHSHQEKKLMEIVEATIGQACLKERKGVDCDFGVVGEAGRRGGAGWFVFCDAIM